jgi:WD40 repeat protein
MAKTSDGRTIALIRSQAIFLWHSESPNELVSVELPQRYSPEPAPTAPAVGRPQPQGFNDFFGPLFRSVQISPAGDRLFTIEGEGRMGAPGVLRVWAIEGASGSRSVRAREIDALSRPEGAVNMALRPDGKVLAVAERSGQVTLLDASNLAVLCSLSEPGKDEENSLRSFAFSPDGKELAVGSQQGTITLWSLRQPTRPHIRVHLPGHRGRVSNLVFDQQGRRLACSSYDPIVDPTVEVWDLEIIEAELSRLKLAD